MWSVPAWRRLYSIAVSNGMVIPCPVPASNPTHNVPDVADLMISSIRWLPSGARPNPPLMALPIPKRTTTVVEGNADSYREQRYQRNIEPPCQIVTFEPSLMFDGFTEWSICTRYVVVVTSDHDRSDLALANEFIEFQSNVDTAHTILIEDTCLCTNHQLVLFSASRIQL